MTRAWSVVLTLLPLTAFADLFSPGELAKAHEKLEGLSNCTQCHPAGQQLSQASCLACHLELKGEIQKHTGFHGRIAEAERACEKCHHEHQGRGAELVQWGAGGKPGFNHARTGWALHGAHTKVECGKCHEQKRISLAPILAMLEKQPGRETFLGLPNGCNNCHFDEHRGQLGQSCEGCHAEKSWRPAPGFSHDQTEYALTGKHAAVACDKCHVKQRDEAPKKFPAPVSETFLKYTPVAHESCTDCHRDPHDGRFGPRCASCHSTQGWTTIRNASQERAFHDKTRFPLKGQHLDVPCVSCHGPFPGQPARFKGLKFGECTDCHADAHFRQLKHPDCQTCHTVDGFSPPRFGAQQHASTRYPLTGAHTTVGCLSCHPRSEALADRIPPAVKLDLKRKKRPELFSFATFTFKGALDRCDSCHADVHQGQLKDKPCATCHQVASFTKLNFQHDRDTRFPLQGKHAEVACEKCHAPEKKGAPVKYRGLATTCASCHADVHAGQLAETRGGPTTCERCHDTKAFAPTKFVHQPPFTSFVLEGKHATLQCGACHKKVLVGALEITRYRPLPQTCEGCHSDFHHGAFAGFEP